MDGTGNEDASTRTRESQRKLGSAGRAHLPTGARGATCHDRLLVAATRSRRFFVRGTRLGGEDLRIWLVPGHLLAPVHRTLHREHQRYYGRALRWPLSLG